MGTLRNILSTLWIVCIAGAYYVHHLYYPAALFTRSFLAVLVLCLAYFAFERWYRNKTEFRWESATALKVILTVWVTMLILGNILYFDRGLFDTVSWFAFQAGIIGKSTLLIIELLTIMLLACGVGATLLRWSGFHTETTPSLRHLLYWIGVGLVVLTFALFVLAWAGTLNIFTVLGVLILGVLMSLTDLLAVLRIFVTTKWSITWKWWSLDSLLYITTLVTVSSNLIHIIRPIPNGWDEYVRYLNTPQLLADSGALFSGIYAYPQELLMSLGFTLFGSLPVALGLSTIMGVLAALALSATARSFVSRRAATMSGMLFLLIPFVIFQSSREVKVDLAATFFAVLSVSALVDWWSGREHEAAGVHRNTSLKWIALAGFFAGAAFVTKYTSLLFIGAMVIGLISLLARSPRCNRTALITLLVFGLWAAVPYVPWGTYFLQSSDEFTVGALAHGSEHGPRATCVAQELPAQTTAPGETFEQTGRQEELGRYLGYATGTARYLLAPWTITMNTVVQGLNVDLGFIFLAFLPPLLLFVPWRRRSNDHAVHHVRIRWTFLALLLVVYWTLWLVVAQGVIWYGLPGVALLLIPLVALTEEQSVSRLVRIVSRSLLAVSVFFILAFRLDTAAPSLHLAHIAGAVTDNQYIDLIIPHYREAYETINATPATPESPNYVYRVGTFIPYFIRKNITRIYTDDQMDVLACIVANNSGPAAVAELKRLGFRFIVLDLNIPTIDETPDQTLTRKWKSVVEFVNSNLRIVTSEQEQRNKMVLAEIL